MGKLGLTIARLGLTMAGESEHSEVTIRLLKLDHGVQLTLAQCLAARYD